MSVESDIFYIGVTGPRKNVIRMLNAAIRNVGSGDVITDCDDIDTINLKLKEFQGRGGHDIGVFDLLDEACMRDELILEKKAAFFSKVKACETCPFDCPNSKRSPDIPPVKFKSEEEEYQRISEYCPWDTPFDAENANTEPDRYIEIVRVEAREKEYTALFSWYLYECYGPNEWGEWEDIARLYDCHVFIDDVYYRNGEFIRFECATIIEPGGIKKVRLESGKTEKEYDEFMDKLAELYPDRYLPIRARYLKEKGEQH